MIKYEFPLNERVRKFLRIEEIFKKMQAQISVKKDFADYSCFNTYFNIMATASRTDLKVELIQEIEKQRLKINSKIKTKKNISINNEMKKIRVQLEKSKILTGFNFGGDKFLHELKTRSDSPSGIVLTDFPDFQFWLETTSQPDRKKYFNDKLKDFYPIKIAVTYLMNQLRSTVETKALEATHGDVQYKLDPLLKNDLVIISLPNTLKRFPNISSNKYAINVHFGKYHPPTSSKLVKFKLGIASF